MQYSQLTNSDLEDLLEEKQGNLKGISYTVIEDADICLKDYNIHLGNGVFKGNVEVSNIYEKDGTFSAGSSTFEKTFTVDTMGMDPIKGAFSLGSGTFKSMVVVNATFEKDFTCGSSTILGFFNLNGTFEGDFDVASAIIKGKFVTKKSIFHKEVNLVSSAH